MASFEGRRRVQRAPADLPLTRPRLCSRIPVSQIFYSLSEVKTPRHLLLSPSTFPARPAVIYARAFRFRGCILCQVTRVVDAVNCRRTHTHTHVHTKMTYTSLRDFIMPATGIAFPFTRFVVDDANARYPLLSAMLYTGCLIETPMIPRRGKGKGKGKEKGAGGFLFLSRRVLFFGEITRGVLVVDLCSVSSFLNCYYLSNCCYTPRNGESPFVEENWVFRRVSLRTRVSQKFSKIQVNL